MNRFLARYTSWGVFAGVPACIYLMVAMVSHDWMQQPAFWAQGRLSHRSWNHLVTFVGAPILVAFCLWMAVRIRKHPQRLLAAAYLGVSVLLAIVSFRTLLVMNIEIVHFPQYAILALLLYPITRHYGDTAILATLGGILDEAYQYFFLYGDRGIHFDFNDVILNSIGAGFGLAIVFVVARPAPRVIAGSGSARSTVRISPVVLGAAALLALCLILAWLDWIRLLPVADSPRWAIVLRRGGPSTMFWTQTTWGKTYHEVQPFEWLVVALVLHWPHIVMDRFGGPARSGASLARPSSGRWSE